MSVGKSAEDMVHVVSNRTHWRFPIIMQSLGRAMITFQIHAISKNSLSAYNIYAIRLKKTIWS